MFACMEIKDNESGYKLQNQTKGCESGTEGIEKFNRSHVTRKRKGGYWAKLTKRKEMGEVRKEIIKTNFVWKILQLSLILYTVIKVLEKRAK